MDAAEVNLAAPDARDICLDEFEAVEAVGPLLLRTQGLGHGLLQEQSRSGGDGFGGDAEPAPPGL